MILCYSGGREQKGTIMERMTITLTDDQAERVKAAVENGGYASQSEVIREALRDWEMNQSFRKQALADLKGEIDKGMSDVKSGRVKKFDADSIIKQGNRTPHKNASRVAGPGATPPRSSPGRRGSNGRRAPGR
jgi:antitoxin ParD1/3/4